MTPRPEPAPPTTDDLTFLSELHAPVEVVTQRMARTETYVERTVALAERIQRPKRDRVRDAAW